MTRGLAIAIMVAFTLAATAGCATFLLRETGEGGMQLPWRERARSAALAAAVVALLAVSGVLAPTWFAVYFVVWWVTLFAVLPFGIVSQGESGAVVTGTEPGAPAAPAILRKVIITTAASVVVFAIVVAAVLLFDIV